MPSSAVRRIRRYPWIRFWTEPGRHAVLGFFDDPPDSTAVVLDELISADWCLILLGEPGLGKTRAIDEAARRASQGGLLVHRVDLGAYDDGASLIGAIVDDPAWQGWLCSGTTLHWYLDGLDEALLHVKAVHKRLLATLRGLSEADVARLRLRISCRSAEWLDEFGEQLGEVLGVEPRVLQLAPLRGVDVHVAAESDGLDADSFMSEVRDRDLAGLAANPLTLRMMLDIAAAAGALPDKQEELFERRYPVLYCCTEPTRTTGRGRRTATRRRSALAPR